MLVEGRHVTKDTDLEKQHRKMKRAQKAKRRATKKMAQGHTVTYVDDMNYQQDDPETRQSDINLESTETRMDTDMNATLVAEQAATEGLSAQGEVGTNTEQPERELTEAELQGEVANFGSTSYTLNMFCCLVRWL